ncbi:MAG TPA: nuclear transport factor 2 family protein, partial [Steroidobacteraceae bacterium]
SFLGDGKGNARIEGGIYQNEYVREGERWKISVAHYYPQFSGPYETGWINEGGADLPLVPYHFTVDETGVPIPKPTGPALRSKETLASLVQKIDRLNDEDAVRNLQHAYGYYVDRKMWDDVVDLFAENCVVEIDGVGTFRGRSGVRQAMERMGPAGLRHGELNDRPIFDTIVQVLRGGREAISRGIELGMLGEADKGTAHWEITVFRNRFVKEDGLWKLRELRLYPLMRADYAEGWGKGGELRFAYTSLPAFAGEHPVTGRPVNTRGFKLLGTRSLTGAIAGVRRSDSDVSLAEARRRLARSMAYDGTENVSSAYGYYIDDFQWPQLGAIFAEKGNKQSPFAGYYVGRDRITRAATTMWGTSSPARAGISYHWRTQLVVHVAADGRSANLRTRLFQPRTGKEPATGTSFYSSPLFSGMYPNDQTVLENGIWRLWSLEIDEPYFTTAGWKGGWSGVKPRPEGAPPPPPSPLVTKYPPDILMTELGRRAGHFRGGTGETIEWPGILPMWFNYRNPVSGRVPEHYWPDCVPCELRPELSMTRHGYLMPPTGPEENVAAASGSRPGS